MAIALSGKKGTGRAALIDDEDWPLVEGRKWRLFEYPSAPGRRNKGPYAITRVYRADGKPTTMLMHTAITGWPRTDHEDHNGLNNQRSNLRPATSAQNQHNRRSNIKGSSRYKGVHWVTGHRRWRAMIRIDGTQRYIGQFTSEEEAALAYNYAALEIYGAYACLNPVDGKTGYPAA